MDDLTSIFNYHLKDMPELGTIHSFRELSENVVVMQKKKKKIMIDEELVMKSLADSGCIMSSVVST